MSPFQIRVAQEVAQFLAEETTAMSRGENQAVDSAFQEQAERQLIEAGKRFQNDQKTWADSAGFICILRSG